MQRNPQAQASASKRAIAKSRKITELKITPDLTVEEQDELVLRLADAKGVEAGTSRDGFIKGEEWYVKDLMTFSAKTAQERFDYEYNQAFHEVASEDEVVDIIAMAMAS